ncbi:MAG: argininosuccinate lyase, partial [Nitratireductor sp.]|nr:argininosuccinate lyase [Nitratireductor sp.]
DKEAVFDAADNLELAILAMTGMMKGITVNAASMAKAAGSGFSIATDLADWLVRETNLPFREAHHVTGAAVAMAEKKGCGLEELSLDDLQGLHPSITKEVFSVLSVEKSVASRKSFGGTAPANVRRQVKYWRSRREKEK